MINSCLKTIRRWWQIRTGRFDTPFDGDVPFWAFSLCVQVILLALLARLILPNVDFRRDVVFVGEQNEDIVLDEQPLAPEVEFDEIDIERLSNDADVQLEIISETETPIMELASPPEIAPEITFDDVGEFMAESNSLSTSNILSAVNTTGSAGNVATGASGAVDRLTQEILRSLEDNETMIVWLFDQSASLTRQRSEIESRIDRIYRELNLLQDAEVAAFEKNEDKPLLTHVYAFGKNVSPALKEPTDDVDKIKAAIKDVQRDESGIENVFTAVLRCVKDLNDYSKVIRSTGKKKRNVMLVIISDEAGDDSDLADKAIKACGKYSMPVYCIGVPAPFGRLETRVKWVDPDPEFDQRPQVALVSQGPESLMPERLQLDFNARGNFRDLEMIDSGFGPFNLTRLCYATGGAYFAVHPNRRRGRVSFRETEVYSSVLQYFFDPQVMKRYRPDYVSLSEYRRRARENQARSSLLEAAAVPQTQQLKPPRFRFPKFNEAQFVRSVNEAQQASAVLQPRLDRLYRVLKEGEKDREREASLRWKAGYDLAMGRVIAARLRSKSYNEMLALSKTKLEFEDPKNNTWELRAADNLKDTGSLNEKLAKQAKDYLNRVVKEHPETPWALLAKRELSIPIGWKWRETFTEPPKPRQPRMNNGNGQRRNPKPQENRVPKKLRPVPKL